MCEEHVIERERGREREREREEGSLSELGTIKEIVITQSVMCEI